MAELRESAAKLKEVVSGSDFAAATSTVQCVVTATGVASWLDKVKAFVASEMESIFEDVVAAVDAQATVCQQWTPQYDDKVTDKIYVKSKCQTLVNGTDRIRLSQEAKALHTALATATNDYMTMAIGIGKIEDNYETIRSNLEVWELTKKAVIVMACLHVLHNLSGATHFLEADTLKNSNSIGDAPVTLQDAIKTLAAKHKAAEPAAKRRKTISDTSSGGRQPCVTKYAAVGA